jgi:hypothetical protein
MVAESESLSVGPSAQFATYSRPWFVNARRTTDSAASFVGYVLMMLPLSVSHNSHAITPHSFLGFSALPMHRHDRLYTGKQVGGVSPQGMVPFAAGGSLDGDRPAGGHMQFGKKATESTVSTGLILCAFL